jgi:hypothetical protein
VKDNPVMAEMERYAAQVKARDFMAQFPRTMHPVQVQFPNAKYIGSERCGDCHAHAYQIWQKTWKHNGEPHGHAIAYDTLADAKHPGLRHFDGECIVCHTTGFDHKTGYYDRANFPQDPKKAAKNDVRLRHVGCENCHGPGSEHVNIEAAFNPANGAMVKQRAQMHRLMNPHKGTPEELNPNAPPQRKEELYSIRMLKINVACQKCHDQENDLHWDFKTKWPKIIHLTPRAGQNGAAPALVPANPLPNDGK